MLRQFNPADTAAVIRGEFSTSGRQVRREEIEGTVSGKTFRFLTKVGGNGEVEISGDEMSGYIQSARGETVTIRLHRRRP